MEDEIPRGSREIRIINGGQPNRCDSLWQFYSTAVLDGDILVETQGHVATSVWDFCRRTLGVELGPDDQEDRNIGFWIKGELEDEEGTHKESHFFNFPANDQTPMKFVPGGIQPLDRAANRIRALIFAPDLDGP